MKIIFIGGVRIGYTVLKSVYESGYIVDTVFTLPKNSSASDYVNFESLVSKYDTKLIRATDVNKLSCVDIIQDISPDLIIVCGWQQLISKEILSIPKLGAIGFHSSLLPKYRGRAPVNWAIIMGERKTGITMFHLTESADSGDIIAQKAFPIMLNDDCNTIYKKSANKCVCTNYYYEEWSDVNNRCENIFNYIPNIKEKRTLNKYINIIDNLYLKSPDKIEKINSKIENILFDLENGTQVYFVFSVLQNQIKLLTAES